MCFCFCCAHPKLKRLTEIVGSSSRQMPLPERYSSVTHGPLPLLMASVTVTHVSFPDSVLIRKHTQCNLQDY